MQREQRRFYAEAHDQEGEGGQDGPGVVDMRQALAQVGYVQRARSHVEIADAQQYERGRYGAEDEVVEAGDQRVAAAARGHQRVAGQRGYLDEDVEVEDVAGDDHAEEAGDEEQRGGLVVGQLLSRYLRPRGRAGIDGGREGDEGDQQQHDGGQRVDGVLDAPRRRPAAEAVGDAAEPEHFIRQRRGQRQRRGVGQQRDGGAQPPQGGGGERYHHRGQQRDDDEQGRDMLPQAGEEVRHRVSLLLFRILSSSMLPYSL